MKVIGIVAPICGILATVLYAMGVLSIQLACALLCIILFTAVALRYRAKGDGVADAQIKKLSRIYFIALGVDFALSLCLILSWYRAQIPEFVFLYATVNLTYSTWTGYYKKEE